MKGGPNSCPLPCKLLSGTGRVRRRTDFSPERRYRTRSEPHFALNAVKFCFVLFFFLCWKFFFSPPQLRDRDVQLVFGQALYNADSKVSFAIKGHAWALWP